MPVKAKQSPAVVRQREKDGEPDGATGVLKIPTRLAGAQALRREQRPVVPSKRPDLSHDATIESPYKRVKRSTADPRDGAASPGEPEASFMPISLSLGPLAGMAGSQRVRGPARPQAQAAAPDAASESQSANNKEFLAELKAKLRERREEDEQRKSVIGGLRDIRDTFMDWMSSFANFTAEIMREDEDSDEWEWTEHCDSAALRNEKQVLPAASLAAPRGGASGPGKGDTARKAREQDPWGDADPWSDEQASAGASRAQACIAARRGRGRMDGGGAGMRAPCTPSSLSLEKRLNSPPGSHSKLFKMTGKVNNLRMGALSSPPQQLRDLLLNDPCAGSGLRHSPSGGSSSPMLPVYNKLEDLLTSSPAGGRLQLAQQGTREHGGKPAASCLQSRQTLPAQQVRALAHIHMHNIQRSRAVGRYIHTFTHARTHAFARAHTHTHTHAHTHTHTHTVPPSPDAAQGSGCPEDPVEHSANRRCGHPPSPPSRRVSVRARGDRRRQHLGLPNTWHRGSLLMRVRRGGRWRRERGGDRYHPQTHTPARRQAGRREWRGGRAVGGAAGHRTEPKARGACGRQGWLRAVLLTAAARAGPGGSRAHPRHLASCAGQKVRDMPVCACARARVRARASVCVCVCARARVLLQPGSSARLYTSRYIPYASRLSLTLLTDLNPNP